MLGVLAIAILTTLHSYVSAQAPQCLAGFTSLYNTLGQSPCQMTIFLGGACNQGSFLLQPLNSSEPTVVYLPPTLLGANPCVCSSVYYSLLSACAVCQNHTFLSWLVFKTNCTPVYEQAFPDTIPSSTRIPHYAYLDVTNGGGFNVTLAESAGGAESTSIPQPTGSATASPNHSKSKVGPIAGGIIGGAVFLEIIAGIIALILRRRKKSVQQYTFTHNPSTCNPIASPETLMVRQDVKHNNMIPIPVKIYEPNDPSTYPTNQPIDHNTYSFSLDINQQ